MGFGAAATKPKALLLLAQLRLGRLSAQGALEGAERVARAGCDALLLAGDAPSGEDGFWAACKVFTDKAGLPVGLRPSAVESWEHLGRRAEEAGVDFLVLGLDDPLEGLDCEVGRVVELPVSTPDTQARVISALPVEAVVAQDLPARRLTIRDLLRLRGRREIAGRPLILPLSASFHEPDLTVLANLGVDGVALAGDDAEQLAAAVGALHQAIDRVKIKARESEEVVSLGFAALQGMPQQHAEPDDAS